MVKTSHDLYLLDEALFSLIFTVRCLLRKSLDCIALSIFYLLSKIDRCKVPFADLLLGLELLMEPSLVELGPQNLPPALEFFLRVQVIDNLFLYFFEEDGRRIVLKRELELKIEMDVVLVLSGGFHYAFFVDGKRDLACLIFLGGVGEE